MLEQTNRARRPARFGEAATDGAVGSGSNDVSRAISDGRSASDGLRRGVETSRDAVPALDRSVLEKLAAEILASTDESRSDRLWPADAMVFQTNPLNVAHGAMGTALFLADVIGELPPTVRDWLLRQPVDVSTYPPGLYAGIAGVAWSWAELGFLDRAVDTMRLVQQSPLRFGATNMFDGCAGWGLAALALFLRTGDDAFRSLACEAGDFLTSSAVRTEAGVHWPFATAEATPIGFAFGSSGVALFLLYLWRVTGEPQYLSDARRAMEFDIRCGRPSGDGDALVWGVTTEDSGHRPYWLRGGAGVVAALARFARVLDESYYADLARRAAQPCGLFFSIAPHQFEGLAAMGDALLDMFALTGDPGYQRAARQKAEQALLFAIRRPNGFAFPGRYLFRISHDFGIGGAGVGVFLHRVLAPRCRRFHDLSPELGLPIRSADGGATASTDR